MNAPAHPDGTDHPLLHALLVREYARRLHRSGLKDSTISIYRRRMQQYLHAAETAGLSVRDLTPDFTRRYQEDTASSLSSAWITYVAAQAFIPLLRELYPDVPTALFTRPNRRSHVRENTTAALLTPPGGQPRYSPDEYERLLAAADLPEQVLLMLVLRLELSARQAAELRWSDIHRRRPIIAIGQVRRMVDTPVHDALAALRACRAPGADDRVLQARDPDTLRLRLRKVCALAGVRYRGLWRSARPPVQPGD